MLGIVISFGPVIFSPPFRGFVLFDACRYAFSSGQLVTFLCESQTPINPKESYILRVDCSVSDGDPVPSTAPSNTKADVVGILPCNRGHFVQERECTHEVFLLRSNWSSTPRRLRLLLGSSYGPWFPAAWSKWIPLHLRIKYSALPSSPRQAILVRRR